VNRRQAKRWVCSHALIILESAMGDGWPLHDENSHPPWTAKNGRRIEAGLDELCRELLRRGMSGADWNSRELCLEAYNRPQPIDPRQQRLPGVLPPEEEE
jgi:hypothetical protein